MATVIFTHLRPQQSAEGAQGWGVLYTCFGNCTAHYVVATLQPINYLLYTVILPKAEL